MQSNETILTGMVSMKRCRKLTKEEKRVVWSKPESNAGVGWWPKYGDDPGRLRRGPLLVEEQANG